MLPELQKEFALYCRSAQGEPPATVKTKGGQVYRQLIQNVFRDTLGKAYPITRAQLQSAPPVLKINGNAWLELIDRFVAEWPCPSPELWRMPVELYNFVRATDYSANSPFPWLEDLLLFEWIEIEVFMMPDVNKISPGLTSLDLSHPLVANQESKLIELKYPVFSGLSSCESTGPSNYFVLCFRKPSTLQAHYLLLSDFHVLIWQQLSSEPTQYQELLKHILELSSSLDLQDIETSLQSFLFTAHREGAILANT